MSTQLQTLPEAQAIEVLRNSLYPGASNSSIQMVLSHCAAAGLDPMLKPVHIVPIWDAKARQMRDVIMPGIGLYRIQAERSGAYAGVDEPEFGEDVTETLTDKNGKPVNVTFPAWCKVTVWKVVGGARVPFSAKERWLENYATDSKDSDAPNTMWRKRPYAQLAKCAEAQALRKAFPELGAVPTYEEMEGKTLNSDFSRPASGSDRAQQAAEVAPSEQQAELILALEQTAQTGDMAALCEHWEKLGKDGRKIVGAAEWKRIKDMAEGTQHE